MIGKNAPLSEQIALLHRILQENQPLYRIIEESQALHLDAYYIGAGCIAQTVWNYQQAKPLMTQINDVDFVYFHPDVSFEAENAVIRRVREALADCPLHLDIKNQARVHIWYKQRFGYAISPYDSIESAINTWPTTATSVGVRLENGQLRVYAPFGLNDLFSQTVRPNKAQITRPIYEQKVRRWTQAWPSLTVIAW